MENKEQKEKGTWKKGLIIYILAGAIWYYSQRFVHSTGDEIVVLAVAILGGYSFYYIDKKIQPVKWAAFKRALIFIGLWALYGFVVGLLTALF